MRSMLKRLSSRNIYLAAVALISVLGGAVVTYTTANGPWGYQDSATYIISAYNLSHGIGLGYYLADGSFHVLTQYPPVYPTILSLMGLFGTNLVDAARWLSILLFAGTIFLAGLIFIQFSASPGFSIPASLLLLVFPTMVRMFSATMSEPLFVFLFMANAFCLLGYFKYNRIGWLVLSAVSTGLCVMARYVGVAILPIGVISVFAFSAGTWRQRLKKTILFGILSSLPVILWGLWVYFGVDHSLGGRTLHFDWGSASDAVRKFIADIMQFMITWLPSGSRLSTMRLRYFYGPSILILVGAATATTLARRRIIGRDPQPATDHDAEIFWIFCMLIPLYLVVLLLNTLFASPIPALSNRMLFPVYIGAVMALLGAFASWQNAWLRGGWRWLQLLPWVIALAGVYWYAPQTINQVIIPIHAGLGATAFTWRNSATMAAARNLPKGVVIVSNDSYAIWVWAGRPAYDLMENVHAAFIGQDTPYGSDHTDPAQVAFSHPGTALVIFSDEFSSQIAGAYGEAGRSRQGSIFKGLVAGGKYPDGVIYYHP